MKYWPYVIVAFVCIAIGYGIAEAREVPKEKRLEDELLKEKESGKVLAEKAKEAEGKLKKIKIITLE